jgi:hypothetical protein
MNGLSPFVDFLGVNDPFSRASQAEGKKEKQKARDRNA